MSWKISGMFIVMLLVFMAFAFSGVATASNIGGAPPGDIVTMTDVDSVAGVVVSMEYDIMIKSDQLAPGNYAKGSSLSAVACKGKDHRHTVILGSLVSSSELVLIGGFLGNHRPGPRGDLTLLE